MPKWRWLQAELQRIVNTLQIRSLSPGQSSQWVLLRQENSSSKCSIATPSGQSFHLGNPPGQSLVFLGFVQCNLQQPDKTSVMSTQGGSQLFPGASGWVWAARLQPMSGDTLGFCHPSCTSQKPGDCTGECFAFYCAEFGPLKWAW